MVPPAGIIITVSVLVAASIAAYENPQVRAWVQRTRQKIAMGLHSLGDEIGPAPQRRSIDISMQEDKGSAAEARRQQVRNEIMERGRLLEERRKRRKSGPGTEALSPNFDTLVDETGRLRSADQQSGNLNASSTALEAIGEHGGVRQRHGETQPESPSSLASPAHPETREASSQFETSPFESRYEREMREAWNIPLSDRRIEIPSTHASESLIELTPTTEDFPDPEVSVPSGAYLRRPLERSDYFSAPASNSSHTFSDHSSTASLRLRASEPVVDVRHPEEFAQPGALTPSIAGSLTEIHPNEADDSGDDLLSEIGDGIRTPGSMWTDVDSTVSGER